MKKIWNEIKPYIYIVVIVVLFRTFVATPAVVDGDSMVGTLNNNDLVVLNKIIMHFNNIDRFDIVVIENDKDQGQDKIIKRVIGLPNEKIEYKDNVLYINDKQVKMNSGVTYETTEDFVAQTKDNEYFVLGDNRDISKDSRYVGNFTKDEILGKVDFRFYPFDKIGFIK